MPQTKFSVAICGGGIAGLTTAIALAELTKEHPDIKIDVYEAASKFSEIGAGIGFLSRPWKILKKLGLTDSLEKFLEKPPSDLPLERSAEMRKSDFPGGVTFYDLIIPTTIAGIQRAKFLDVLLTHIDPNRIKLHNSRRLVSYTQNEDTGSTESVQLQFSDGSTAVADVLLGADGIHSPIRHVLLNEVATKLETTGGMQEAAKLRNSSEALWSGTICYRALIPSARLKTLNAEHRSLTRPLVYGGKDKHIIAIPIAKGTLVNVAAFVSWPHKAGTKYEGQLVEERNRDELLGHYAGWEDEVQQLLQCIDKPLSWVINEVGPLSTWISGRVAILGDAAHAMTPHQGSGAGQALEDGYILATLLAHPLTTRENLPEVLKIYEEIRLPFANDVLRRSAKNGRLYEFNEPGSIDVQDFGKKDEGENDAGLLWNVGQIACENWKWTWMTTITEDQERALKMLEQRLTGGTPIAT